MNPGGIRADLLEDASGNVTYGAAFNVQPFNNYVVSETLTGQQVLDALNQQWNGRNEGVKNNKILQVAGRQRTPGAHRRPPRSAPTRSSRAASRSTSTATAWPRPRSTRPRPTGSC